MQRDPRPPWRGPIRRPSSGSGVDSVLVSLRAAVPALLLFISARAVGLGAVLLLSPSSAGYALRRLAVHWDAYWYLDIAQHGYDHAIRAPMPGQDHHRYTNLAFFPVYPALIRALHTVLPVLPWGVAGLVTAGLCALVAAWGIHAAVAHRYGPRVATLAALLWGIAPTAVVESAGYSESAFTALTAWALFAVLKRRWLTAGVLALLAGLTRPTGIAVVAALCAAAALQVWETLRERGTGPGWLDGPYRLATGKQEIRPEQPVALWRPITAALISPLGWLGFVAWTGLRLHKWNAYFKIQALWKSRFDFGHTTGADFRILFTHSAPVNLYFPVGACALIAAVLLLAVTVAQRQPLPFLVLGLVMVVITIGDAAYFSSRARFLLPAFPLLLPLASGLARTRNRTVLVAVLVATTAVSALYGAYLMLYSPSPP
ncbi:mannosyltransferase family protein [Streptacidiphilus sp. P02-A3a]|uniref:mannosyltransferase family protein n=1 Tax=Streptacidiphilus sp. P02-A3a TaxID=2704468 RepID=UPI0015FDBD17|nr:mannosyltransferase family protein [Streptacidiphilus sp. P02-A3a]QMU69063.1 hypothetical protein GXP74_13250 [Streptacidiphilus sp. P02-A3a]